MNKPRAGRSGLTGRQAETLRFIKAFTEERGYSPTFQDIADGVGYRSKGSAHRIVNLLIDRGYVESQERSARSLIVVESADENALLHDKVRELTNENTRLRAELTALKTQREMAP